MGPLTPERIKPYRSLQGYGHELLEIIFPVITSIIFFTNSRIQTLTKLLQRCPYSCK